MRKANSLVKRDSFNILTGLKEDLSKLKRYSFFDSQNEEEAKELGEGILHSVFIKEPRQGVLQGREFSRVVNYDKALTAKYYINKKEGMLISKIFCYHEAICEDRIPEFRVRSMYFDWKVTEIPDSNERVPTECLRRLSELKIMGLKIDALAVATPVKQTPIKNIAKEEFKKAGIWCSKRLGEAMGLLLAPLFALVEDPILLARFGNPNIGSYYVEVGRWL